MSKLEKVGRFLNIWGVPGSIPPPYPLATAIVHSGEKSLEPYELNPQDEGLLGDPSADTIPQEIIDETKRNVDELLERVFENGRIRLVKLGTPNLEWRVCMPQNAQNYPFENYAPPLISISKEQDSEGKNRINLKYDFSDEERNGELNFDYFDGECTIDTTYTNHFGETIVERDDVRKPLPHILRMGLFYEALGFMQNERNMRRNQPLTDYSSAFSAPKEL